MQAPQPPVQLWPCKEEKYIASESHMEKTGYDMPETRGQTDRVLGFIHIPQRKGEKHIALNHLLLLGQESHLPVLAIFIFTPLRGAL